MAMMKLNGIYLVSLVTFVLGCGWFATRWFEEDNIEQLERRFKAAKGSSVTPGNRAEEHCEVGRRDTGTARPASTESGAFGAARFAASASRMRGTEIPTVTECRKCKIGSGSGAQWPCRYCGTVNWNGKVGDMDKVLALDFDGVIHRAIDGWKDGTCYDVPHPNAIRAMKTLQDRGFHLIVFTTREDLDSVHDWLVKWWPIQGCTKDRLCYETHPIPVATNQKPGAVAYIDDRAWRFDANRGGWEAVLDEFTQIPR